MPPFTVQASPQAISGITVIERLVIGDACIFDRWAVRHSPLVAQQVPGAHRQFVFGEAAQRAR
jgi:hypothetical protein